ncbi:MAG: hypothetical protein RL060_2024 [Bacteroidota bacterium]|jgi:hypothetical protein
MKKTLKLVSLLAITASVVFSSCSKDKEEVKPLVPAFKDYSMVLAGAQNASTGSYYASGDNSVKFSRDSASFGALVDLSFAQTGTTAPGIPKFISLNARSAEGLTKVAKNTTNTFFKLSSITAAQFDTLTYSAGAVSGISLTSGNVIEVAKDKVYEFHNTTSGAKGLIRISDLVAGTNFDGVLSFKVKVLK